MKKIIPLLIIGTIICACPKKNIPDPKAPNCKLIEITPKGSIGPKYEIYKSTHNNQELVDSITVKLYDENTGELKNKFVQMFQKFDENNNVIEEYQLRNNFKYTYNDKNQIINSVMTDSYGFGRKVKFQYEYRNDTLIQVIRYSPESLRDTVTIRYNLGNWGDWRPTILSMKNGTLRWFRGYDKNGNFAGEYFRQYTNAEEEDYGTIGTSLYNASYDLSHKMDFPEFKYIFGNGNRANYLENPRLSPYPTTDTEYDRLFLWPRIGGTDTHWNFNATTHSIDGRTLSYHNYEFKYECE